MINHTLPTYKSSFSYFILLQNKQSHRHSLRSDTTRCIICISNNIEYLDKKHSYRTSTKEVLLIFAIQLGIYWTKVPVIGTLTCHLY